VANSQKDSATTQIRYQSLNDSDECCDECNGTKVIPARLSALLMMDGLSSRVKRFDSEKEN